MVFKYICLLSVHALYTHIYIFSIYCTLCIYLVYIDAHILIYRRSSFVYTFKVLNNCLANYAYLYSVNFFSVN